MQVTTMLPSPGEKIQLHRPGPNERVSVWHQPGHNIALGFDPHEVEIAEDNKHLTISFDDGGHIVVEDFFHHPIEDWPEIELFDGTVFTGHDFLAIFDLNLLHTALGRMESGVGEYHDDPGNLIDGIDRLGMLGTDYWGRSTEWRITDLGLNDFLGSVDEAIPGGPGTYTPPPTAEFHFDPSSEWQSRFVAALFEDGLPYQHIERHGEGVPEGTRLDLDLTTHDGTVVNSITLFGFPVGTRLFLGDPNEGGVEVTIGADGGFTFTPENFSGDGVWILPPNNNSDADWTITYQAELSLGDQTGTASGSFTIIVDAVADRPDMDENLDADYGQNEFTGNDYEATTPGGLVTINGQAKFYDLDGSEVFYILLAIPDRAWGLDDWGDSRLLSSNSILDFWREIGNFPAEGVDLEVDAALRNAFRIGDKSVTEPQYLLLEYDPATGQIRVFAQNTVTGEMVEVSSEGVTITLNDDGTMNFSINVRASDADRDSEITIESLAVTIERPEDQEFTYSNNISESEVTATVDVQVKAINGRLTATLSMAEDAQENQNQVAPGEDPETGPKDTSLSAGYDPETGMPITMTFAGDDPADGEYVYSLTIGALPPASQGIIFYDGVPVYEGQVITGDPGSSDWLNKFSFKPAENFSGDVEFNFTYTVASTATGPVEEPFDGSTDMHVDSVADLADGEVETSGRLETGDVLEMEEAEIQDDGWAVQNLESETSVDITFTVRAVFYDLDGSEEAWIDILLPQGFSIPEDKIGEYELVSRDGKTYVRIAVPDLDTFEEGQVYELDVTLTIGPDAVNTNSLEVRVVTHEKDILDGDGHSLDNNQAERVIEQDIPVHLFSGSLTVKAGWAYEGSKNADGIDDVTELGLDAESTNAVGAPIVFEVTDGTLVGGTITIPTELGTLYLGNTPLTPDQNGVYTLSAADLASGQIYFRPAPGISDQDVNFSYSVQVQDERGNVFTISGESTTVIDAVADAGTITEVMAVEYDPEGSRDGTKALDFTIKAEFTDNDGSERHYILIERPTEDWTCDDAQIVTIPFGEDGNPLKPTGYDEATGQYTYDLSLAANFRTFFIIDVTDQSANGGVQEYVVRINAPDHASDIVLKTGTLSVEQYDQLSGTEWDVSNNEAYNFEDLQVNFADADAVMDGNAAFEDHEPSQNLGIFTPSTEDGIITIDLDQDTDFVNTEDGFNIVLTFNFNPAWDQAVPGTFSCNGYSFDPVEISPGVWTVTIPASVLPANQNEFTIRYTPSPDDDTDLTDLSIAVPIVAGGTGDIGVANGELDRLVVDAVADKPDIPEMELDLGGYTAAISGAEDVPVKITAGFYDFKDGSEQHYLVFDLTSGINGIDPDSLPDGWSILTGDQLPPELQAYGDNFVIIHISNEYLQKHDGKVEETISISIDTVTEDTTLGMVVTAVAIDNPSDGSDETLSNNFAGTRGFVEVEVHVITSDPVLRVETAYENDQRLAHLGNDTTSMGAALSIAGMHPSEDLVSATLTFSTESGQLWSAELGDYITAGTHTLTGGFTLVCTIAYGLTTLVITGPGGTTDVTGQIANLSFVPAENYKDNDIPITFDGTVVDRDSGLTESFEDKVTEVVVDAVAQKPEDASGDVAYEDDYSAAYDKVTVTVSATFRDTGDDSEQHFLLIEVKDYFNLSGWQIVQLGFGSDGTILTPNPNGGWLNPNPANGTDQAAAATSVKNFIQIPVDEFIGRFDGQSGDTIQYGDFSVTLNPDGSFTVTYTAQIEINPDKVTNDVDETILAGGMSHEDATRSNGDGSGGREGYDYNNYAYDLTDVDLSVAVVETTGLTMYWGRVYEKDAPDANQPDQGYVGDGDSTAPGDLTRANGTGLVAVVRTNDGVLHPEEEINLTITIQAVSDGDGGWIMPGYIWFNDEMLVGSMDLSTGIVTYTVVLSASDAAVMIGANPSDADLDASNLRFIPNYNTYNESDVKITFQAEVVDTTSGASTDLPSQSGTIVVDAVADLPIISDVRWTHLGEEVFASATPEITLEFNVYFPDTGTGGVTSEGQYILIQQLLTMDLTGGFKAMVEAAGYTIDVYPVMENGQTVLYYRIPVEFFTEDPAGSNNYKISIELLREGGSGDALYDGTDVPTVIAQSIVENAHGGEITNDNNTAHAEVPLPELLFADVDTYISGGSSTTYENDNRYGYMPGHENDKDGGVEFGLGVVLGRSPNADGTWSDEVALTDIIFEYDDNRGLLEYYNGTDWVPVPNGGGVPLEFSESLRFTSIDDGSADADKDVPLKYTVTIQDPASGATKELSGTYKIIVDAVAERPQDVQVGELDYSDENGDGGIGRGETVTFDVTVTFPDHAKGDHADHYILVQCPGDGWTVDFPDWDYYVYNGETYFRIPVDATEATMTWSVTLIAPSGGSGPLVYENSNPIKVGALTIDRDPNNGAPPDGDREPDYTNNWAYSDFQDIEVNYETDTSSNFWIGTMYENNTPNANELGPDGQPNRETAGGEVYLPSVVDVGDDETDTVESITLHWDPDKGTLYDANGPITPSYDENGNAYYTIDNDDFGNGYYFRLPEDYSDEEDLTVTAEIETTNNGILNQSSTPIVDAVAQVPTDVSAAPDYEDGYGASPDGDSITINVSVTFEDFEDGSESHYILIENKDGWQIEGGPYEQIQGPDGNVYYMIPVNNADINPDGTITVPVTMIPPESGGTDLGNGREEFTLGVGAMSQDTATDAELRDDNNVAYNLGQDVTVVTSSAETRPYIQVGNTYANGDREGDGTINANDYANVYIDGANPASDTITEVVLTYSNENGELLYQLPNGNWVSLESMPGVSGTDVNGQRQVTITNPDIIDELISGNAGGSNVVYAPYEGNYSDTDVNMSAQITVKDNFSSDTHTGSSSGTIIVDAVAQQPTIVQAGPSDPDYVNGVPPGEDIEFSVTAIFPDSGDANTLHYLAIQQLTGWNAPEPLPKGVTIQTYQGITYYTICIEDYAGISDALVQNPDGSWTFSMALPSPDGTKDVPDAGGIILGAVTIVEPEDTELNLGNNVSVVGETVPLHIGVVETTQVDFVFAPIQENGGEGTPITMSQTSLNDLNQYNEKVTETTLAISGDFTGKSAGDVVGTVVYGDQTFPVILGADGKAYVDIDFGPDGYDASERFVMVWGAATVDGGGNIVVSEYNHTGGTMSISSESTVVDKASNDTQQIGGSGSAQFIADADAPTDIETTDPNGTVGGGSKVSFTVNARFVDVDGSETHYILVEKLEGWSGEYQVGVFNGKEYFMVPVNSRDANASVTVNLTTPDDSVDGTVNLEVSGLSVDGGTTAVSDETANVQITISAVTVTGVDLAMGPISEGTEDAPSRTQMLFSIEGGDATDTVSIRIPNLKGGRIWDDESQAYLEEPIVLDGDKAAAGNYYYEPAPYTNGNISLDYTATARDTVSGQTKTFQNSGTVEVTPVANPPEDFAVNSAVAYTSEGAVFTAALSASFPDQGGTEQHFFVASIPYSLLVSGVPEGWILLDGSDPRAGGLASPVYLIQASPDGTASLTLTVPDGTNPADITFLAGAMENGNGSLAFSNQQTETVDATAAAVNPFGAEETALLIGAESGLENSVDEPASDEQDGGVQHRSGASLSVPEPFTAVETVDPLSKTFTEEPTTGEELPYNALDAIHAHIGQWFEEASEDLGFFATGKLMDAVLPDAILNTGALQPSLTADFTDISGQTLQVYGQGQDSLGWDLLGLEVAGNDAIPGLVQPGEITGLDGFGLLCASVETEEGFGFCLNVPNTKENATEVESLVATGALG